MSLSDSDLPQINGCPILTISEYKIKNETNKKTKDTADILEKWICSIHKYASIFFTT
jgi:hypothetical protein